MKVHAWGRPVGNTTAYMAQTTGDRGREGRFKEKEKRKRKDSDDPEEEEEEGEEEEEEGDPEVEILEGMPNDWKGKGKGKAPKYLGVRERVRD